MSGSQLTRQNSRIRRTITAVPNPATTVVRTNFGYKSVVPGGYRCNWTSHGDSAHLMLYK
ncbi:hypothetical protein GIB67_011753 [Kingdonia uniflora]|uniref:Uncharacterized protein n=1 Tax=Kingdonia uniflora TaxID=39325 RepID=A0A7J7LUB9_9MAGN|nr:hypothetical protein GIB67_011753 [Kingdonia uniflora]